MRSDLSADQLTLGREVDRVLDSAPPDTDPRDLFTRLGDERLLAVHYPSDYGGRGMSLEHHAVVAERIGAHGLPDVVHLVTVQGVGCTVLSYGSEQQRTRWLPEIAAGRILASLLLSEEGAGSDLTRIGTAAVPDRDGWRISGVKAWSLYADWSRIALCSARTRGGQHRYDGISLFLVDLAAAGIRRTPVPRAAGEPYCRVELDDVRLGPESLVGPLHKGWSLLPTAIGFERGGLDYLSRAASWLRLAEKEYRRLPLADQAVMAADLVQLRSGVANARMLAFHAAHSADRLQMDEVLTAYVKLACGRAAQAVARWAGQELSESPALRAAVAEAPELTISGGPQELQFDLIASEFPIGQAVR